MNTTEWKNEYMANNPRIASIYESLSEMDRFWIDMLLLDCRGDGVKHGIKMACEEYRKMQKQRWEDEQQRKVEAAL